MDADDAVAKDDAKSADFFDIDMFNLDGIDFNLAADEFCDAYAAFLADAGNKRSAGAAATGGWLGCTRFYGDSSSASGSSTDSSTTDEPVEAEGGGLSAYACELERCLLENADVAVNEASCPDGEEELAEGGLSFDDFFGAAVEVAAVKKADEESLDAREDGEPTSRKRARYKIMGQACGDISLECKCRCFGDQLCACRAVRLAPVGFLDLVLLVLDMVVMLSSPAP